jgi:hypothetical protein
MGTIGAWLLLLLVQDDAVEARIGEVDAHRPAGTEVYVHAAPTLDRAVSSYRLQGSLAFRLENGVEEPRALRFLGWKMPERRSVLLAGDSARRKLLVGGAEEPAPGEVVDAFLVRGGAALALALRRPEGVFVRFDAAEAGPYEEAEFVAEVGGAPAYVARRGGRLRFHLPGREFDVEGRPLQVAASPDGSRVAWIEGLEGRRQRVVLDGRPGVACDLVHTGLHPSPNGRHVAWVTRQGKTYRGWIDGVEIPSDRMVVSARVFDDGTPVACEMWSEALAQPPKDPSLPGSVYRGRLVVGGRPEERILPRPVYNLDPAGPRLFGAARTETQSVLAWISPGEPVRYEEIKGPVGRAIAAPAGERRMFVQPGAAGTFVWADDRRLGPYDRVADLFWLEHTGRFGFLATRANKTILVVGGNPTPLALSETYPPVRISKTEMTAAVVGIFPTRGKKEIWTRVIPLE